MPFREPKQKYEATCQNNQNTGGAVEKCAFESTAQRYACVCVCDREVNYDSVTKLFSAIIS